ncbi:MAG: UDP-3-O-(3-hydroxymyristoyl)glucosamine N-acyltransferase [Bacteroidales bacterium]|nr:UDP-3-O-(3-hydroxymyristoyl)glucosamine N-acyltransferase [Bacteroidales bacterium]
MKFTAEQIANVLGGVVVGDGSTMVETFAKIEEGVPGAISFMANAKYEHYVYSTASSIVLVNHDFEPQKPHSCTLVKVANAYEAIARLLTIYQETQQKRVGISPQAYIAETATIGQDCYIAPFAYIGEGVSIGRGTQIYAHSVIEAGVTLGEDCIVYPNVTIYYGCKIGHRVVLHAGSVIGADGFGFAPTATGYDKIPQIGIVTIEDDVELGANTCVDRATMGSTYVRRGAKLDNLVQIAHNVDVGAHTVMSAQVGVAGSTKVGEWCMFGGQVGIAGHATIGDRVKAGAQAGIPKSLASDAVVQGTPAVDARLFARSSAALKQLPEMYKTMAQITKDIEALKAK